MNEESEANGWMTKDGRLYVFMTLEEMAELIGCERDDALDVLFELNDMFGKAPLVHWNCIGEEDDVVPEEEDNRPALFVGKW